METRRDASPNAHLEPQCRACATFARALATLTAARVPFLVGGGFAVEIYLGAPRAKIKDLDLFLKPVDVGTALRALNDAGFRTKLHEPGWLAKAFDGEEFIDLIFATRNELLMVDDESFVGASEFEILGHPVHIQPVEELIATKLFVCARDRFDVSDISHLILKCGNDIDWDRLIARIAPQIEMLHVHLLLFQFLYPGQRQLIPQRVYDQVEQRARESRERPQPEMASRGLCLDPVAFAVDIERWGFFDSRRTDALQNVHVQPTPGPTQTRPEPAAEGSAAVRKAG